MTTAIASTAPVSANLGFLGVCAPRRLALEIAITKDIATMVCANAFHNSQVRDAQYCNAPATALARVSVLTWFVSALTAWTRPTVPQSHALQIAPDMVCV